MRSIVYSGAGLLLYPAEDVLPPRKDPELARQVASAIGSRAAELGLRTYRDIAEHLAKQDATIFKSDNPVRVVESWMKPKDPALSREQTRWKIAKAMDIPPSRLGLEDPRDLDRKISDLTEQVAAMQAQLQGNGRPRQMSDAARKFVSEVEDLRNGVLLAEGELDEEEELFPATQHALAAALAALDAAIAAEKGE